MENITPDTLLSDLANLSPAARKKLASLGAQTLADVANKLSRSQLKRSRNIGTKTLETLQQTLSQAGLVLSDNRLYVDAGSALQQQLADFQEQMDALRADVDNWVLQHRADIWAARQRSAPGAYGDYVRAQLEAMNEISADPVIKREFEHQLVRSLNRYQKQTRYAKSKDALMDSLAATGRRPANGRGRRGGRKP